MNVKVKRRMGKKFIRVDLPFAPSVVIEAENNREAWKKYRNVCGIIATEHQPRFSKLVKSVTTDSHGVVPGSLREWYGKEKSHGNQQRVAAVS